MLKFEDYDKAMLKQSKKYSCHILRTLGYSRIVSTLDNIFKNTFSFKEIDVDPSMRSISDQLVDARIVVVPIFSITDINVVKFLSDLRVLDPQCRVIGITETSDHLVDPTIVGLLDVCLSLDCLCTPNNIKFVFDACLTGIQINALRCFLDNGPHGYWIWDVKKDILEWSDKTLFMTLGDNAIAPKTISEFRDMIHPLDRNRVVQAVDNHLKYNTSYKDIKMRLRTSSGDYSQFISTGYSLRDQKNRASFFVGSICDISKEETSKKLLEQSERKYSFLFYEMSEAAILADVESGIILEVNKGAEVLFGRTRTDLIGSHQSNLHPASFASEAKVLFRQHILSLITNKRDTVNAPIVRVDGSSHMAEINSSLIDCDGKLCILGLFRKLTD